MKNNKKLVWLALLCLVILAFLPTLGACEPTDNITTNIIDDKYRNYYEIFVWSFFDTNNDGIGDLNGVTQKLDYIKDLGFNGIWLMPVNPGTSYHKYDVEDYYSIDEQFGTVADMENLLTQAHDRGINVIMDLVVNHSSSEHTWFKQACQYIRDHGEPGGDYGDYYNFSNSKNGQSKWEQVGGTSYCYEAQFWSGMPDLNLDSVNLKAEIANIMKFWLDKGVDGFRLDAVTSYYTGNVNKNVEFLTWLADTAHAYNPDAYIVGEAWTDDGNVQKYYESTADSFFLFSGSAQGGKFSNLVMADSGAGKAFSNWQIELQNRFLTNDGNILAPFLGNHDTARPGSFLVKEDRTKMAAGLLSMMSGSVFVYYGEEIGMLSKDAQSSDPHKRIAIKWQKAPIYDGMCYTTPENITITDDNYKYPSVEEQLADENSILNYYKQAMLLRNRFPHIARGTAQVFVENVDTNISIIKKTYNGESIVIVINLDPINELSFTLDTATLGIDKLVGKLCLTKQDDIQYNSGNGAITMPYYSIAVFSCK